MKIAFITALREDCRSLNEYLKKRVAANLAPLYLAGYLDQKGIEAEIQIKDRIEDFEGFCPDFFGVSSVTENIEVAKSLAAMAKSKWGAITILGGVHVTALPQSLPKEFDLGVVGEGEQTFFELVKVWQSKGRLCSADLNQIKGLVFHDGDFKKQTGVRRSLDPLDQVPVPARGKYIKQSPLAYMMTSRGCPYTCAFCVIPSTSPGYRTRSPEAVVEEIRSIKAHDPKVKNIRIFDDLFIVNRDRVRAIAEKIDDAGLNRDLSFGCWGRANLIDEQMIESFKLMNMAHVAFGAESGSSAVLSDIKPGSSLLENQRAIDHLHAAGIQVACSVILGHPRETEADLMATYNFLESNLDKLFDVEFNVALPWPGTDLWEQAKRRGMVDEQMDFSPIRECADFSQYSTDFYPYLNEIIPPERFDYLLARFKKLSRHLDQKNCQSEMVTLLSQSDHVAKFR